MGKDKGEMKREGTKKRVSVSEQKSCREGVRARVRARVRELEQESGQLVLLICVLNSHYNDTPPFRAPEALWLGLVKARCEALCLFLIIRARTDRGLRSNSLNLTKSVWV